MLPMTRFIVLLFLPSHFGAFLYISAVRDDVTTQKSDLDAKDATQETLQSITTNSHDVKVLYVSHNSESRGPEAYAWFHTFLETDVAKSADVLVGCQQEAVNDNSKGCGGVTYPMTFPNYLRNAHGSYNTPSWKLLAGPAEDTLGDSSWEHESSLEDKDGNLYDKAQPPHHDSGVGWICGQENRDDECGSCQFMSVWTRKGQERYTLESGLSDGVVFPDADYAAKITENKSWWKDMFRNKGILAATLKVDDIAAATLMCAHLPPTNGRSEAMRYIMNLPAAPVPTLTGDLNFRPVFAEFSKLSSVEAWNIANEFLANVQDLHGGLRRLESRGQLPYHFGDSLQCSAPGAKLHTAPSYARWYESAFGQQACKCYDVAVAQAEYIDAHTSILNHVGCREVIMEQARYGSQAGHGVPVPPPFSVAHEWCTQDGAPNCVALLAYACLFQHEISGNPGKVKMKKEEKTHAADGGGGGGNEVSTIGWLDRTCWQGAANVSAHEIVPYIAGDASAYKSDHAPVATMLTIALK